MLHYSDGTYYVGHTDNLENRISEHQQREVRGYTYSRRPVQLIWHQECVQRAEALEAERQIKGWNRAKKEALVRGDFVMIARLASRSGAGLALRDALLRKAPQGERGGAAGDREETWCPTTPRASGRSCRNHLSVRCGGPTGGSAP
ncbi:MAG: GIY-YIG nuclease family protein [Chrysiogenetes bacterium]|nr:GIY-YIG nuclease family protein [Chrysiogenetes bacterium]